VGNCKKYRTSEEPRYGLRCEEKKLRDLFILNIEVQHRIFINNMVPVRVRKGIAVDIHYVCNKIHDTEYVGKYIFKTRCKLECKVALYEV